MNVREARFWRLVYTRKPHIWFARGHWNVFLRERVQDHLASQAIDFVRKRNGG